MSTLTSLMLAIELAEVRRDQARAQWQKLVQSHQHAQGQLNQLQQYAAETEQRWTQKAQVSASPELLHHHYQFMARLQQAMALQDGVLSGSERKVSAAKALVLQAEFRLASFRQVLASRQLELSKVQQRREQKQMDEFASLQMQRLKRIQSESSP